MPAEYRADLVVLLVDGKPVLGIIVEVQLQPDARKRFSWPVYVAGVRARFECPCCVLVVTASESTAKWAKVPIALGPGAQLAPLVVAPNGVPVITDPERARQDPELAVLSVMAHGHGDVETAVQIALSAVQGSAPLDEDTRVLYFDVIEAALSEAARKAFEMLRPFGSECKPSCRPRIQLTMLAFCRVEPSTARGHSVSNAMLCGCSPTLCRGARQTTDYSRNLHFHLSGNTSIINQIL